MQESDSKDQLREQQKGKQAENIQRFLTLQCPICLSQYQEESFRTISQCQHRFCRLCIQQHGNAMMQTNKIPTCPQCLASLDLNSTYYRQLKAAAQLRLNKIISYHRFIHDPKFKPCQSQTCAGVINIQQKQLICDQCGSLHCRQCFQLKHNGECIVKTTIRLEITKKFRQCSQCGQIIQKVSGCTHMTCTCGHYFCYSCGQTIQGNHNCRIPSQLSCLQKIRWQVQHKQMWYQSSRFNFLKMLISLSPDKQLNGFLKVMWLSLYTLVIYPLMLVVGLATFLLTFLVIIVLFLVFTLAQPFLSVFSRDFPKYFPNKHMIEMHCIWAVLLIVIFYPFIYIMNFFQFFYYIFVRQEVTMQQFCLLFTELFQGLKYLVLFPCLMLVDNQQFYLTLAKVKIVYQKTNQKSQKNRQNANEVMTKLS